LLAFDLLVINYKPLICGARNKAAVRRDAMHDVLAGRRQEEWGLGLVGLIRMGLARSHADTHVFYVTIF
jgi:hypothetical protein